MGVRLGGSTVGSRQYGQNNDVRRVLLSVLSLNRWRGGGGYVAVGTNHRVRLQVETRSSGLSWAKITLGSRNSTAVSALSSGLSVLYDLIASLRVNTVCKANRV